MSASEPPPSSDRPRRGAFARFLDVVEWLGNLLPHPVTLFALICVAVLLLSGIAGTFEWQVADPRPEGARGRSPDGIIRAVSLLNPEGLRMPNEMVRHKMLDAVGDLALAGYAIDGHLIVHKGGHELHRQLVAALLARPDAWALVEPDEGFVRQAGRAAAAVAGVAAAHV